MLVTIGVLQFSGVRSTLLAAVQGSLAGWQAPL